MLLFFSIAVAAFLSVALAHDASQFIQMMLGSYTFIFVTYFLTRRKL